MRKMSLGLMAAIGLFLALPSIAATPKTGSSEKKPVAISVGGSKTVTLVDEYDPEEKEFYGSGACYLSVTLARGQSYTVWIDGANWQSVDMGAWAREATDAEYEKDIYGPTADFGATDEYSNGAAAYLYGEDWEYDDPASWTYYIYIGGDIGQSVTVHVEKDIIALDPEGAERNPLKFSVSETESKISNNLIDEEFYLETDLKAGRKYFFRTMGGTESGAYGLEVESEVEHAVWDDPAYESDSNNEALVIVPYEDGKFNFVVTTTSTNQSTSAFTFVHRQMPTRPIAKHPFEPIADQATKAFLPGRMVAEEDYYDDIVDEKLYRVQAAAGDRWVFDATGADRAIEMVIYDANGNVLTTNDGVGDESYGVRAAFQAKNAGYYYVGVYDPSLDQTNDVACAETTLMARKVTPMDGSPDEWDAADDDYAGASALTPLPVAEEAAEHHGPHLLNESDWYDTFSIAGRKGVTYSVAVDWAGEETSSLNLKATVFKVVNSKVSEIGSMVIAPGGETIEYTPTAHGVFYIRLEVAEGIGLDYPAYNVVPTAWADSGTLYNLTVNMKGAKSTWQLANESTKYEPGMSVLVLGKQTVRFNAASSDLATPTNMVVNPAEGESQVTLLGVYNDKVDPKDDVVAGASRLNIAAKPSLAKRTLWAEDNCDWFQFTAKEGFYYNFDLVDLEGDAQMAVFTKEKTGEGKMIVEPTTKIAALAPGKGDFLICVNHASEKGEDASYSLQSASVNVGAIKFASASVKAQKTTGVVKLTVNRTAGEGKVRVLYGTVNDTAKPGVDYVAQNGELVWENGDKKAKTIEIKLIPELFAEEAISRQLKVQLKSVEEKDLTEGEYLASIATPEATITLTENKGKAAAAVKTATTKTEIVPLETGTYQGVVSEVGGVLTNGFPALASVTLTAKDATKSALSAKVSLAGKTYTFTANAWGDDDEAGNATAELIQVQKIGKEAWTNVMTIAVVKGSTTNGLDWTQAVADVNLMMNVPDANNKGVQEGIQYNGQLYRNNAKIQSYLDTVVKAAGYYTVGLIPSGVTASDGIPAGYGYLTLTLDAKGTAKVAGKLADGTTSISYSSIVAVGEVVGEDYALYVPVYVAKSPSCFGGTLKLVPTEDGTYVVDSSEMLLWNNDNAKLTYEGEEGWQIDLQPVGGYFNTVNNLQTYYITAAMSVSTADISEFPTEALAAGYDYVTSVEPDGTVVDVLGNAFTTEKKALVKNGKVNDLEASVNPCNVQVKLARATGLVSGSFSVWSENADGTAQKEITNLKHAGVLLLSRDAGAALNPDMITAGYFTQATKLSYEENGRTKTRTWTASLPFCVQAVDKGTPDWYADDWGEAPTEP